MPSFDVIVVTPPGSADPALAIAACRAGMRGCLDLEFTSHVPTALAGIERLERFTTTDFGIKLGCHTGAFISSGATIASRLRWVLLAGGPHPELEAWIRFFHDRKVRVLLEAINLEETSLGQRLGVDGLILKGHEAGGRIASQTAFVLVQQWLGQNKDKTALSSPLPFWVQGGIGLNSAAACQAAGAAGVVLDAQVLLARESLLGATARKQIEVLDGSETVCLGERLGEAYRLLSRPGMAAVDELRADEERLLLIPDEEERRKAWRQAVAQRVKADPEQGIWLLGQEAATTRPLAERFRTVAGIGQAILERAQQQGEMARRLTPLAEGSPLAVRHGTRYPIVQGPMTRVSDTAPFAEAVARAGALPFLALALMRQAEVEKLLRETRDRLGSLPWGAGILGFAPPEIRREQTEAIRAVRPPFALIAGGRPDQARELEKEGIPTYLHVPSPGLLRMFLREGARQFIFEGRECGGHVGPRSSFVLWDTMVEVLLEHLGPGSRGEDLNILFAGGIHDGLSSSMVAALAAPLAERGVAIGVLLGTAYLYTAEAVGTGAIVPSFQREALRCQDTVLLETGPGHAIRCIPTPYAETFERQKNQLQAEGKSPDEVRDTLDAMNIGRLRIASKGLDRAAGGQLHSLDENDQIARGMYMIGQVASLRHRVMSMAELHEEISAGLAAVRRTARLLEPTQKETPPADIAIIGMSCMFPGAGDLPSFWHNILNRVDAITEVPPDHWDWRLYYDPNAKGKDKITSKWGGFLSDVPFDPLIFGMPPASLRSIEPVQLMLLEAVRRALADAGYANRPFDRERAAVVLGTGGGAAQLAMAYGFRSYLPMLANIPGLGDSVAGIQKKVEEYLPEFTEDSFPGILLNVAAGRIANRFNLGGPNFSIDAACGSSLAALYAGVRELETGTSDLAIVMGADTVQNPYTYLLFSKTHAFSPRGRCSTFDEAADGIVISEGVGVVILKRLADAERDGDRIYAVIKGVGASSDGKDKGLTAPRPEGQRRALERAYARAGVSPARVGLVEAHGTGTVVGDQTEVTALGQLFRAAGAAQRECVVGSVKSMIGHTKCAAGLAGLINATLALHHKTLPPLLVQRPNSKAQFEESPFFLNAEARPWIHGGSKPRCAGVSAFGFGGTNFHAVLEEYTGDYLDETPSSLQHWPAELLVWRRPTRAALREAVQSCQEALAKGACPELADLAFSLTRDVSASGRRKPAGGEEQPTLVIVASSLDDLKEKLPRALAALQSPEEQFHDPRGIFFAEKPSARASKIAFLFPGQGSQYPDMLAQLALAFPEVRQAFDEAEQALEGDLDRPLGKTIFPPSPFTPEEEQENRRALTRTDVTQPAIGAASLGMFRLLGKLGIEPDFLAGHSYGDYAALCAAGALSFEELIRLSHRRGRVILDAAAQMPGTMAAIDAPAEVVEKVISGIPGVTVANRNSPRQTVISGTEEGVDLALKQLQQQGLRGVRFPVACGFHSPLVAAAREPLAEALAECHWTSPRRPVYANTTAEPYPADPAAIADLLADHLAAPVRFQEEIEALHQAGARIFIEVGPQGVLTGLVGQILADQPYLALPTDLKGRPSLVQLQHLLAQLLVHGVAVQLDRLHEGRRLQALDLAHLDQEIGKPKLSDSTWLVNSVRVRPLHGPEPKILGPAPPSSHLRENIQTTETVAMNPASRPNNDSETTRPAFTPPIPTPTYGMSPSRNGAAHSEVSDEASQVMLRFQDLMARFLDTQRSVMQAYLQGSSAAPSLPSLPPLPSSNGHPATPPVKPSQPVEPPAAPAPAKVHEASSNGKLDREKLTDRLLQIVCQRTGYPPEMIGLDLDLEADLGIDSIKRVEILGSLSSNGNGEALSVEMEKLTGIKTLRGIIECLAGQRSEVRSQKSEVRSQKLANGESVNGKGHHSDRAGIQRMLVRPVEAPLPREWSLDLAEGTVLITDDGQGVAQDLRERLRKLGRTAVLMRMGSGSKRNGEADAVYANLTDPAAIEESLRHLHQKVGPVAGLIHLLPLAEPVAGETWDQRVEREVKSLFLLACELGSELRQSKSNGQTILLAATAMGGQFGAAGAPLPETFFPGQGGVAGLVKSLAHEWPEVLVRVVDLDRKQSSSELAAQLFAELGDPEGSVEIGHHQGRRISLECVATPLETTATDPSPLGPESTLLITGGARGITAAVALELARRYRPNLVIVGRSALPESEEPANTATLTVPAEIKAALIARLRSEGRPVAPLVVEAAYQRLLQDREIRTNLHRLRETGARVHYYQADVRDETAFTAILDEIDQRFGGLEGVIHGAGVIQDKLVQDKTPESFDRVFGTKVDSALILARRLKPERLKFCAFFASVAGRFGNRGQSDYAAANEVMTKLAVQLDQQWPGRVVSVVWGPWSGIGMVSELEAHLGRRGLQMIPPEVGPLFLIEELIHGRKGDAEVVIAGDVGQLALDRKQNAESREPKAERVSIPD